MVHLQPTPTTSWYYSSSCTAVVPLLLWNAILLVYNTLWISQSPFTETATPPPIAPTHGATIILVYTRYYSNPTAVLMYRKYYPVRSQGAQPRISGFPSTAVLIFSTRYFLYQVLYFLVVVKHSTLFIILTRVTKSYLLALGTTQIRSFFTKHWTMFLTHHTPWHVSFQNRLELPWVVLSII